MTDAPASTAATDWETTSSTVYGRCGDIVGVCAEPVTAQVMMTFLDRATRTSGRPSLNDERSSHCERQPHYVKQSPNRVVFVKTCESFVRAPWPAPCRLLRPSGPPHSPTTPPTPPP